MIQGRGRRRILSKRQTDKAMALQKIFQKLRHYQESKVNTSGLKKQEKKFQSCTAVPCAVHITPYYQNDFSFFGFFPKYYSLLCPV